VAPAAVDLSGWPDGADCDAPAFRFRPNMRMKKAFARPSTPARLRCLSLMMSWLIAVPLMCRRKPIPTHALGAFLIQMEAFSAEA
jgi:hypothetical protein